MKGKTKLINTLVYRGPEICFQEKLCCKINKIIHSFIHFILFSIISKQFNTKSYKYWKDQEKDKDQNYFTTKMDSQKRLSFSEFKKFQLFNIQTYLSTEVFSAS